MTASNQMQEVAEEAIIDYFRFPYQREPFHPDYLEHVIPDEHRGVISRAIMALVNKRWIVKCGRRKDKKAARKGAEANEYRLTELGRNMLVGMGGGGVMSGSPNTAPHSGENAPVGPGVLSSQGAEGEALLPPCASADPSPGEGSPAGNDESLAGEPRPGPEPLSLLPEPDPEAWAA